MLYPKFISAQPIWFNVQRPVPSSWCLSLTLHSWKVLSTLGKSGRDNRARFTDLHKIWLWFPSSHSPSLSTYSLPFCCPSFFPSYSSSYSSSYSPSYFYSPLPRDWPLRFSELQHHLYLRHNSSVYCNSPTLSVTRECVVSSQADIHSLAPATHFHPFLSLFWDLSRFTFFL